jgi:hypothetical protein
LEFGGYITTAMKSIPKRFLAICLTTLAALSVLVAAFNIIVDPYILFNRPRVMGFNAMKPSIHEQLYLIKAYDVARFRPKTLLIGSSGVAIGLNARSSAWPTTTRPIYNLGLLGGTTSSAYRYLQHALTQGDVTYVVLGVEFRDTLAYSPQHEPSYETRLLTNRDGSTNRFAYKQELYDVISSTLSFEASLDSASTVIGNIENDSSDIEWGDVDFRLFEDLSARFGPNPSMTVADLAYASIYRDGNTDSSPPKDLDNILELCQKRHIKLIIVIDPAHADELEITYLSGKWEALEAWKRNLTNLVARFWNGNDSAELWDFYEYDRYSTESLWSNPSHLRWFLNPSHYTQVLGDKVIGRVFGVDNPGFGAKLTPGNIETRLLDVRRQRLTYHARQPHDKERVENIYAQIGEMRAIAK